MSMAELNSLLPIGSAIFGGVCAYFGAFNALRERLAKIEARQDGHDEDIRGLRSDFAALRDRLDRHIESGK